MRDVGIFDLLSTFTEILQRVDKEELREIFIEKFTVAEQIDKIVEEVRTTEKLSLKGIFEDMHSRQEMVCTFLALLELIRLKHIRAVQEDGYFGDILIVPAGTEDHYDLILSTSETEVLPEVKEIIGAMLFAAKAPLTVKQMRPTFPRAP